MSIRYPRSNVAGLVMVRVRWAADAAAVRGSVAVGWALRRQNTPGGPASQQLQVTT